MFYNKDERFYVSFNCKKSTIIKKSLLSNRTNELQFIISKNFISCNKKKTFNIYFEIKSYKHFVTIIICNHNVYEK